MQTYSPVSIFDVQFTKPSLIDLEIPKNQTAMVYVIEGELKFHDENQISRKGQMIYFDQSSDTINLTSISSTGSYLVLAGEPLNEPIVRYGPFVTNTEGDMKKAMLDYQSGKMGTLSKILFVCRSPSPKIKATELLKFIDLTPAFIGIVNR